LTNVSPVACDRKYRENPSLPDGANKAYTYVIGVLKRPLDKGLTINEVETLKIILNIVNLNIIIKKTSCFQKSFSEANDIRYIIHPKSDIETKVNTYFQVFEDKHGFKNDLSIIDLIFNMGKHSLQLV
jgi:hypothetical protein